MSTISKGGRRVKPERRGVILLRHATPRKNLPGIGRAGLLCSKSKGKLPVVWLHATSKTAWALIHVVKRHGGRVEDVVVIELAVPRKWLRRSRRGLWFCRRDVPPGRFLRLIDFAEVAGPSLSA
jgi:hypothetical protein